MVTKVQRAQLGSLLNKDPRELVIVEQRAQFEIDKPMQPQIIACVDKMPWPHMLEGGYVLILPPLASAAVMIIAACHGRGGYWPQCVRMIQTNINPPQWSAFELMTLSQVRNEARVEDRS
jgi:hypothetical protein